MTPSSLRLEFAETAARGLYTMTELCARYGVSRRVGYKWLARYHADGAAGLADQSRRPRGSPRAVSDDVAARLLACRQRHPTWGPRKLLAYLARRQPRVAWPAASTVGELLKRHGLVRPRRRRPQPGHPGRPTTPMDAPNAGVDRGLQGPVPHGRRDVLLPAHRLRRLLAVPARVPRLLSVETTGARGVFERLFRAYGLPVRIAATTACPSRRRRSAASRRSPRGGSSSGSRRS
jgi:transposase